MLALSTPAILFLLLNLIIGIIALASWFGSHNRPHQQHHHQQLYPQLGRAPSLLERVRSGDFSLYRYAAVHSEPEYATQLERTPSLLERIRSVNFSAFYGSEQETEFAHEPVSVSHSDRAHVTEYATQVDPCQLERTPSLLERVKSISFSSFYSSEPERNTAELGYTSNEVDPPKLERGPSFLERIKSIKFSSLYKYETETEDESDIYLGHGSDMEHHQVTRSKSDPREGPKKRQVVKKMKKSQSERAVAVEAEQDEDENGDTVEQRRPATTRLEKAPLFADEEVDAKADDFISRFRQQLKLQRLDSLLRHRDVQKEKQKV